jgi:hypothetical protein
MITKPKTRPARKVKRKKSPIPKIFVGMLVFVVFILAVILVAQSMVDTKAFREAIRQAVKEKTGQEVTLGGRISISLLPTPTITIPGLELRGKLSEEPEPAVIIPLTKVYVSATSILTEKPDVTGVVFQSPVLEITRARNNYINWGWLNSKMFRSLSDGQSKNGLALEVHGGKISYFDKRTDEVFTIENVNLSSSNLSDLEIAGAFTIISTELRFNTSTKPDGTALEAGERPLFVRIDGGDKGVVTLKGTIDTSQEDVKVKAALNLEVADLMRWVQAKIKHDQKELAVFDKLEGKQLVVEEVDKTPVPLKVSGNWLQEDGVISISKMQLEGFNSSGKGKAKVTWEEWRPHINADFNFAGLDYNQWSRFLEGVFVNKQQEEAKKKKRGDEYQPENPLPTDVQLSLRVSSEQFYVSSQIWKNFELSADLLDASVTVNNFSINLPGESNLTLFGLVSQGNTGGLRFEGSMETSGKSLRQMLTVFDESASDLPETGFGDFFARANLFISPEQVRLSEADVKLSDLRLNGGMVAYFDSSPRLEADVKLKNINFDYFRDVWREKNKKTKEEKFFLRFDRSMKFNWLRKLHTNIDLKVAVDGFTFLERPGDSASFRIFVKPSEFGIYDIRLNYPYETLQASFNLNVVGEQPYINVVLNTNELNMDYFNLEPAKVPLVLRPSITFKGIPGAIPPEDEMTKVTTFVGINGATPPIDGIVGISSSFMGIDGVQAPAWASAPVTSTFIGIDGAILPQGGVLPSASGNKEQRRYEIKPQAETIMLAANDNQPTDEAPSEEKSVYNPRDKVNIIRDKTGTAVSLWSSELIDMSGLEGFQGTFDISVGRLIHGNLVFDRLKMQAKLENNMVAIQNLAFMYWQGRCSILGSIYGGKVPGLSLSFTLFNIELKDMLKELTGRDNITGRASLSGSITTSGVNYLSWISQSEAKLVLAARGVFVKGINLQGVVETLAVSRTAADVFNNVNLALINGNTTFNVDGNLNVRGGNIKTPGITLRTGNIIGDLTGEIKMVPWTMELSTLFQFPTITSETIPTLVVQNAGPIEDTKIKTDTSSLEAYVAKRIISK